MTLMCRIYDDDISVHTPTLAKTKSRIIFCEFSLP